MAVRANSLDSSKLAFWLLAAACLAPLLPLPSEVAATVAPTALVGGTALGLTSGNPYQLGSKPVAKWLLQASVVLLGFSMDIGKVAAEGRSGLGFSLISITSIFALGWILQKVLKIRPVTGLLVSAGTAICGGSAIAAVSSVIDAPEEDVTVAVGTVFLLNAVALAVFPMLGHLLNLSQSQFGVWAGLAIHDIASVVGAGTAYGPESLDIATAVKLSRVLYLIPITLIAAWFYQRGKVGNERSAIQVPWFVGLFLLASLLRSAIPAVAEASFGIKHLASAGFALSLFLIGAAITRTTLKSVGARPLVLGGLLWIFVSASSLIAVRLG